MSLTLQENLLREKVSRLPMRDVIEVQPATIVRAAVARMRSKGLGCAIIVGVRGEPVGIFTERSVLDVLIQDSSLEGCPVSDFADAKFIQVRQSEPIMRVWDAIQNGGFRFVCVTDDEGKLIGLTGQRGLAEYICEYFPQQVMVQRVGGKPYTQQREGA